MSRCQKCGTENRDEARFCKKCGTAVEDTSRKDRYFSKDCISEELDRFRAKVQAAVHLKSSGSKVRVGLDSVILGPVGSGKNFIAHELYDILLRAGLVSGAGPVTVDAPEFLKWADKMDSNIDAAKDGVLLVTDAHKLLPEGASTQVNGLDRLFSRMRGGSADMPVVIMTGLGNWMDGYLEKNPDVAHLFEFRFSLSAMSEPDLAALTGHILQEKFKLGITPEAQERLKSRYEWLVRMGEGTSGNGHLAALMAEELATNMFRRGGSEVDAADVLGEIFTPRNEEEIWRDLDGFIGLQSVKDEIRNIVNSIREAREEQGPEAVVRLRTHYVFTGNPGTGKTTIARKFAEILAAVGALPKGQFVEVAGKDLISDVIGGTERNVRDCVDRAMGGVLFIDEAYGLKGQFGQDGIDTLVPILENRMGDFVCIVAGYRREMGEFMKMNSGLKSRFRKSIDFPDYNAVELEQLFLLNVKKNGYELTDEAAEKLHIPMEQMYNRRTDLFGNGRDVRNFFDAAVERRGRRLESMDREARKAEGKVLTYEDIVGKDAVEEPKLQDVLKELDGLTGLEGVKNELRLLAATIVQEQRKAMRKGTTPQIPVYHYMFLGNPGTGKTTVARLMGRILYSLGVLSSPEVVEVNRDGLVAGFQGHTAEKTRNVVMSALGGVLFIDEAYALVNGEGDSFGQECINTLVPLLVNYKGKFVCIVAGYTREMMQFMASNSGLASRFPKKIMFEDYDGQQMHGIFLSVVQRNGMAISDEASAAARRHFDRMFAGRGSNFGNARDVMNFYETVRDHHNVRLMYVEEPTEEQENTITLEDVCSVTDVGI